MKTTIDLTQRKDEYSRKEFSGKLEYVRVNIDNKDIIIKIENFIKRTGIDFGFDIIKEKILNDDLFAACFIKDSSKQNFYEKEQLSILKNEYGKNIDKLSSSGKDCIRLIDGEITYGESTENGTKSLDFIEKYDKLTVFYFAKFTEVSGGAQDNQYNDAKKFLEEADKYVGAHDDDFRFVALLDGSLYQKESSKQDLGRFINSRVKVHDINSIETETWV